MKKIFLAAMLVCSVILNAQVTKVSLQATGLTCSMCSNSINKALKGLDFIDKIDANIKNSSFEISFKPNSTPDFDKIKKKVEDAGYSVAKFWVTLEFNNVSIDNDAHAVSGNTSLHFLNVAKQTLNGSKTIRLLDKGFVSAKEYKKNSSLTKMQCYSTGEEDGKRMYHATL